MNRINDKLTVYFNDPFWVGVFEKVDNGSLAVAKVTFGAEPKDIEIKEFLVRNYYNLRFSPAVDIVVKEEKKNPKRLQRDARKQTLEKGIGTKSQQALKLQQEENKLERKVKSKEKKIAEAERQFELRQQKKKEKHRGH